MDFSSPVSDVIPSAQGAVLAVLVAAGKPLTGRAIAGLTNGRVGQSRTNQVLGQLAQAGIVTKDEQGVGNLYQLNHEHVAAPAILILARMRDELVDRMTGLVATWDVAPEALWMFGSAARGQAGPLSDIDLLVVRPDHVDVEDVGWSRQVDTLTESAHMWSGNDVRVLDLSRAEIRSWADRGEPLIQSLRREAIHMFGARVDDVLVAQQQFPDES